ncbi:MAG: Co2+/Mg2+ efflux protein ApaG [Bacteroidota bacterium]
MQTAITEGVIIRVKPTFRADLSDITHHRFFFNYSIEIKNTNHFPVQLLHRDWFIFDSLNESDFVSGEGVIGVQPVLDVDQEFSYTSGCELYSELGAMNGFYTFKNLLTSEFFQVHIPKFVLEFPPKLN